MATPHMQHCTYCAPLLICADLHTDRLAGNKQRQVAQSYREAYCPNDALPGFAFHQTDRDPTNLQTKVCPGPEGRCSNHSRVRDFDLLGYRYSLLSSIGTGGLNNVLNMLPARDEQEFNLFPQEDLAFVHDWMAWTDQHVALLKLTRPVPSLAQHSTGMADGTIMLRGDNTGAMFLFNPTAREVNVSLPLSGDGSASLGFTCAAATMPILVRQLTSSERTAAAAYNLAVLDCVDVLHLTLPATSARVLMFEQWAGASAVPLVLGSPYATAVADSAGTLTVSGAKGESGTPARLVVALPKGSPKVTRVVVNAQEVASFSSAPFRGLAAVAVQGSWAGLRFRRAQEILPGASSSSFRSEGSGGNGDGTWVGSFSVPQALFDRTCSKNCNATLLFKMRPKILI